MRRSEWILGGLFGILVVAVIAVFLIFWTRSRPESLEESEVKSITLLTAKVAYELAQPVAEEWAADAALLTARANWPPGTDPRSGNASWNLVFYSPGQQATAMISVVDNVAMLLRSRPMDERLQPGDISNWQIDSPAAIEQLLSFGGSDFFEEQANVSVILTLDTQESLLWKSTFMDTEDQRALNLNINAANGELSQ